MSATYATAIKTVSSPDAINYHFEEIVFGGSVIFFCCGLTMCCSGLAFCAGLLNYETIILAVLCRNTHVILLIFVSLFGMMLLLLLLLIWY